MYEKEEVHEITLTVTELTKDEEYSFRVSAVNEVGTSEYSDQSEFIKVGKSIELYIVFISVFAYLILIFSVWNQHNLYQYLQQVAEPIKPEAPMVKEILEPVVTGLRQSIVLRCVITGTPLPNITWTRDDKVISSNTSYENFTATLSISETNSSSSGLYTCKAANTAGTAETSATVVIQGGKHRWIT